MGPTSKFNYIFLNFLFIFIYKNGQSHDMPEVSIVMSCYLETENPVLSGIFRDRVKSDSIPKKTKTGMLYIFQLAQKHNYGLEWMVDAPPLINKLKNHFFLQIH